jgi:hypothetical protein
MAITGTPTIAVAALAMKSLVSWDLAGRCRGSDSSGDSHRRPRGGGGI